MTATEIAEITSEQTLAALVAEMRVEIAEMRTLIDAQVTLLNEYKDLIQPTLEQISNSAIGRMLFGGTNG